MLFAPEHGVLHHCGEGELRAMVEVRELEARACAWQVLARNAKEDWSQKH